MSALGHKQTCAAHKPMSAKCQQRTFGVWAWLNAGSIVNYGGKDSFARSSRTEFKNTSTSGPR